MLDRLLDILLVLAIRTSFRQSTTAPRWYRASADPRLNAALQAIHEDAGRPWSVPELAEISGLSRAAFARTFRDALGQTPMQYLTDWRMTPARDYLRNGELGLAKIANVICYGSPYAFAAAFRRHHGDPPGAWRQRELTRTSRPVAGDRIHLRYARTPQPHRSDRTSPHIHWTAAENTGGHAGRCGDDEAGGARTAARGQQGSGQQTVASG